MIYWTPLELDQVFNGWDQLTNTSLVIQHEGRLLEIEPLGNGVGKITRLISSDPNDYLQLKFSPGELIGLGN